MLNNLLEADRRASGQARAGRRGKKSVEVQQINGLPILLRCPQEQEAGDMPAAARDERRPRQYMTPQGSLLLLLLPLLGLRPRRAQEGPPRRSVGSGNGEVDKQPKCSYLRSLP